MSDSKDALDQFLSAFHSRDQEKRWVSAAQGSRFAKEIAGDYNPLHDQDAPRFCVPGDLLFALTIGQYGLARQLELTFKGMLRADTVLLYPEHPPEPFSIVGDNGREYVTINRQDPFETAPSIQLGLIKAYVACSGQTFPDLLQPLLAQEGVMFNPDRPFVVYDRMVMALDRAPQQAPSLQLARSGLQTDGKRGDAHFEFAISDDGQTIGHCRKQMVVSGLRPYNHAAMAQAVAEYQQRRAEATG